MRVVVIGAGIVGASTAFHLAQRGSDVDVVLVDRADTGRATDAGAGIICPWISTAPRDAATYRLHVASAIYYPELVERLAAVGESDTSYAPVGGLFVSADDAELAAVHDLISSRATDHPAVGVVSRVDEQDVRRMFPPLRSDLGGVHVSGGGRVDGRVFRDALVRSAVRSGVRKLTGSAELVLEGGRVGGGGSRVDGVRVGPPTNELIEADAVVVATGAWAVESLEPAGVELALAPQKGQIVHLELAGVDTSAWPIVQPPGSHYLLAFPGSRVVVGATRETGSGYDERVTAAGLRQVLDDALTVAPGLADARVIETRVGLRPLSGDGIPLLGRVPNLDNLVVATGLGPTGLTAGPYAGVVAANLSLGDDVELDLAPFRPDRS